MSTAPILVWFRNDLRLDDHPALHAAVASGRPVIPVYLHTPAAEGLWPRGAASRWWLHHALRDFAAQIDALGARLVLRSGTDPAELLKRLLAETGAESIYWNRRYDPIGIEIDKQLKAAFPAKSFPGNLLREPHEVKTLAGDFYKVFTPFYKAQLALGAPAAPLDAPRAWPSPAQFPPSESLDAWNLLPRISWDRAFYDHWNPGAAGAAEQSDLFLDDSIGAYKTERDFPAKPGTSRLSPFLHFGQISPRRLWHEALDGASGSDAWLRQLVWRDFAIHLLFHQPQLDLEPLQPKFRNFPWRQDPERFRAWCRGQTGYPIVDAGMRELWSTGWMHNRVRMIVASFLVKDLLIPWQDGARWFWDTLVDADLANNSFGWQWTAGCGADAAPYFRIFNPVLQSRKFDPDGHYLRRWLPELASLSTDDLHAPWEAKTPPAGYPAPIVDHSQARDQALEALSLLSLPQ
jgi:deoxyribodipyrimidine photo-lyase